MSDLSAQRQITSDDLKTFHTHISTFLKRVPDEAWERPTGSRAEDWTLHQTLAHLLAVAQVFNKAADAALRAEPLVTRDFERREQLETWNQAQVDRLVLVPPNGLIVQYLQELRIAHDKLALLTNTNHSQTAHLPNFNRPARAIDFIHWQMSHAGIVHGAQIIATLNREPLWQDFNADFTARLVGYYLQQWSMIYWNEYGTPDAQTLNFHIGGAGGGAWHIVVAPDGGSSGAGARDNAQHALTFANPYVLFGVFSGHLNMRRALANGQMQIDGDMHATLDLLRLFSPAPPRL
ncbi:MAG: maleylpyruvate isomerase N-terminal domain-containing protein [Anaerolineae bacterium]